MVFLPVFLGLIGLPLDKILQISPTQNKKKKKIKKEKEKKKKEKLIFNS